MQLLALRVFFFLSGVMVANWTVRIPAVKDQVDASATSFGLALLCLSIGGLVAMATGGRLCLRFGSRRLVLAGALATALTLPLPGLAGSVQVLGAFLAIYGVMYGTFTIALNSAAVEAEAAAGRPIMSGLHGLYSTGSLAGAVVGGVAAEFLAPLPHLALVSALGLLVAGGFGRPLLHEAGKRFRIQSIVDNRLYTKDGTASGAAAAAPGSARRSGSGSGPARRSGSASAPASGSAAASGSESGSAAASGSESGSATASGSESGSAAAAAGTSEPTPAAAAAPAADDRRIPSHGIIWLFGAIAFSTAFMEFANNDWAVLHLREDLGTAPSTAAFGYATYECAIAVTRLAGGWLIRKLGEATVLIGGCLVAAGGIVVASWAGSLPGPSGLDLGFGFAGYIAVGIGVANLYPIAIARAGALGGPRAVSRVAPLGSIGILVERPLIGFLADHLGLPGALSTVAILGVLAAGIGFALRTYTRPANSRVQDLEGLTKTTVS